MGGALPHAVHCRIRAKKERPPFGGLPLNQITDRAIANLVAAASAAVAAAAGARTLFAGFGDIDGEGAAGMILAVEGCDGRLCLRIRAHLHKTETLGAAGIAVGDNFGAG